MTVNLLLLYCLQLRGFLPAFVFNVAYVSYAVIVFACFSVYNFHLNDLIMFLSTLLQELISIKSLIFTI